MMEDESWSLGKKQQILLPFSSTTKHELCPFKTNVLFLDLKHTKYVNIEQGCNWFIPQSLETSVQTAFEAQNSCVDFQQRQPAPKSTASCSYFKWAVSSTFKWNLRPPTSLLLKFLLLSAFPSSFSTFFRIQKGNLFVIDFTSAHISFSAFVFGSA